MRKLFKGGNYSRAETIRGNTVFIDKEIVYRKKISSIRRSLEMFEFDLLIIVAACLYNYCIFKSLLLNKMWKTKVDVSSIVELTH